MELTMEPDIYAPNMDSQGNYIDKIPAFNILKKGVYCPCGSRKDKIYDTHSMFSAHIKTKNHQKWLADLNTNKSNLFIENQQLKETVQNQRLIIAKMDIEIKNKNTTIDCLAQELTKLKIEPINSVTVTNLIDL